jgi:hypothetical protein
MLSKLTDIGFRKVGIWSLANGEPDLKIEAEENSANILYCFVVDGLPKYVGKTVQPLKKRMYGYRKPAATQSTNIRNNGNIKSALENGSVIELYVLPDNGLLHFGEFHLNLAAGLEDSIVSSLSPEWNSVGK